ncbi:MAG TPA: DUF2934 domain-containing protein, partial [Terriglobales bacterium]|nr:DUF2934 domain-containing protein [Terriglobales bacterium]
RSLLGVPELQACRNPLPEARAMTFHLSQEALHETMSESLTETSASGAPSTLNANTPEVVLTEMIEQLIRERAFQLYAQRGYFDGYAEKDWYQAELEVLQQLGAAAV